MAYLQYGNSQTKVLQVDILNGDDGEMLYRFNRHLVNLYAADTHMLGQAG